MKQEPGTGTTQADPVWETAHFNVFSHQNAVCTLRRQIMEFLNQPSSLFTPEELADVELAVGEACTNAYKHGSPNGELDEVRVTCMKNERTLILEVSDNGCGFDPNSLTTPDLGNMKEGGIGIFLIRTLVDSVEFDFSKGTTVRMTKHHR